MYYQFMYLLGRIRRRYINQIPEGNRDYKKSRQMSTVEGSTAVAIVTLVGGSYLSGFLELLGVEKGMNGIISALPALLAFVQPLGAALSQNLTRRKPFVTVSLFLSRLFFSAVFFIPLMAQSVGARIILVVLLFSLAHLLSAFAVPAVNSWIISLTPQRIRGRYFGIRERFSLVLLSVSSLGAGFIIDKFKEAGDLRGGFIAVGVVVTALMLINTLAFSKVMEPQSQEESTKGISLGRAIKMVLTEKGFRPVLMMHVLYNISMHLAVPYHSLYLVSDLNLSYGFISLMVFVASVDKALVVKRWGRLADRTSWANVLKKAFSIIGIVHIMSFFLMPSTARWLYPITVVLSNIGWAPLGMGLLNIQFDHAPLKGRAVYIGVCGALTGVMGFLGVYAGSLILRLVDLYQPTVFGLTVRGQQLLMPASGLLLLVCAAYVSKVVGKQKKIINRKEGVSV